VAHHSKRGSARKVRNRLRDGEGLEACQQDRHVAGGGEHERGSAHHQLRPKRNAGLPPVAGLGGKRDSEVDDIYQELKQEYRWITTRMTIKIRNLELASIHV